MLIDIEAELRRLQLWDSEAPSAAALASTQPFAVDTLTLPQWLQFIFLPRMRALLEGGGVLPERCGIVPIAEEYFRGTTGAVTTLLKALGEVDELLSGVVPNDSPDAAGDETAA